MSAGIKELDKQTGTFKMQLEGIKSEIEALKKVKENLEMEIAQKRSLFNSEIEKRHLESRKEEQRLKEFNQRLLEDRSEFEKALNDFKKEKVSLEKEQQDVLDMKTNTRESKRKVSEFYIAVRKAYEAL